jgi:hypothetical protein
MSSPRRTLAAAAMGQIRTDRDGNLILPPKLTTTL